MSKDDGFAPSAQMLILFLYICRQAFKETRIQMIDNNPGCFFHGELSQLLNLNNLSNGLS
jgi:hypothetical protein